MADITVATFAEFRTAAAQYENTIICPEGAVWDMSEVDPDNTITSFEINSNITGNNTEIRNFRGRISCANGVTIHSLHIINLLCEIWNSDFAGAIFTGDKTWLATMEQCRISIATGSIVKNAMYNICIKKCAVNLQMAYAGACNPLGSYQGLGNDFYNRVLINAPNATSFEYTELKRSEIIINAPLANSISTAMQNCTVRGNMPNVTASSSSSAYNPFSVISATAAPNFPESSGYIKKVTDAQMRDAAYLQSIGFVIGTE